MCGKERKNRDKNVSLKFARINARRGFFINIHADSRFLIASAFLPIKADNSNVGDCVHKRKAINMHLRMQMSVRVICRMHIIKNSINNWSPITSLSWYSISRVERKSPRMLMPIQNSIVIFFFLYKSPNDLEAMQRTSKDCYLHILSRLYSDG